MGPAASASVWSESRQEAAGLAWPCAQCPWPGRVPSPLSPEHRTLQQNWRSGGPGWAEGLRGRGLHLPRVRGPQALSHSRLLPTASLGDQPICQWPGHTPHPPCPPASHLDLPVAESPLPQGDSEWAGVALACEPASHGAVQGQGSAGCRLQAACLVTARAGRSGWALGPVRAAGSGRRPHPPLFPSSLTSTCPSWTAPTSNIPVSSRPSRPLSQGCLPCSHSPAPLGLCRELFNPRLQTRQR